MYNFFFTSFGKAYMAHLLEPKKRSLIDILWSNNHSGQKLMEWDNNVYFSTIQSMEKDVNNASLCAVEENDNTIVLYFDDKKNNNSKIETSFVEIRSGKKKTSMYITTPDANEVFRLNILVRFKDYESTIIFHLVPHDNLYNVVLDFGSEASQMLISKRVSEYAVEPSKVFVNTLRHFFGISKVKGNRVYDQQDEDEYLFRSIFYLKKNAEMTKSFEYEIPSRDDMFFSFLSKRTESHEGRIPNIKIAYLTGANVNGVADMSTLHRGIVSRFLHEALYSIRDMLKEEQRTKKIGVNFIVLLPNVMPQNAVSSFLENMTRIANSKEFLDQNQSLLSIERINVNSCSESDASFLEYLHQAVLSKCGDKKFKVDVGKRYLIIDIGKGTTDFSIVKLLSADSAISEYRAGFVGAGNAISYAIFYNYMKTIAGAKADLLLEKMLKAEPAVLYELENKIEDCKRNRRKGKLLEKQIEQIERVESITSEAVLDRIDELGDIDDAQGEVSKMLDKISDRIVNQIPLENIDYIIFSGRSFKFEKLRNKLETRLKELKKNIRVFFNSETAKKGCLFGPLRNISLSLESQMVGFPIIVDVTKLPQTSNSEKGQTNTTSESIVNADVLNLHKTNTFIQKATEKCSSMVDLLKELFGSGVDSDGVESLKSATSIDFKSEVETYMTKGKEIKNMNENSRIIISGNVYAPGDRYAISREDGPFYVYFDGVDFYLKHKMGCHRLELQVNSGSKDMLKESQFPYSLLINS